MKARSLGVGVLMTVMISFAAGCGSAPAGSCTAMGAGGGTCTEYSGLPGPVLGPLQNACEMATGTWSGGGCTRAGAVGSCRRALDVGTQTAVFYGGTADNLRMLCEAQGGTWQ